MGLDPELRGKRALVTGGGTGIGRAISLALAGEGVDLVVASRTRRDDTLHDLRASGVKASFLGVDLADEASSRGLIDRAADVLGGIDLVVANAAMALHEPAAEITTDAWTATLTANLLANVWICSAAAAHMIGRGAGSILIVGSTAQYVRAVGQTAYHVSKTALATYGSGLALDLAAFGIRVNLLVPGRFDTPLARQAGGPVSAEGIPLGRVGALWEAGPAAVFLLSDALASYVTGAELAVTGGLHLRGGSAGRSAATGTPTRSR